MITEPRYNLVIIHTPRLQDVADFITIGNMLIGAAPDICVIVLSIDRDVSSDMLRLINSRPTLIFCPTAIDIPESIRGHRITAKPKTKYNEYLALRSAGMPVPNSTLIRDIKDVTKVSQYSSVVVKPNSGMQGKDVNLVKVSDLKPYLENCLQSSRGDMLAQEFINTGPYPTSYRVFTVLGKAVYCVKSSARVEQVIPEDNLPVQGIPISSNGQERSVTLAFDSDIINLAECVHQKFPDIPTMGIDIIRQCETHKLYVLEINSRGLTWHISSNYGKAFFSKYNLDIYNQFDALKTISLRLVETTRKMAV
jgi:hypothetical protein